MVVERPIVEGTFVEITANGKTAEERSAAESTVNKRFEIDSFVIKWSGTEDLWWCSYSDSLLLFHFSSLVILHGSDKPGEPGKPGDMINILKSQGEPGKVREKISKILQVMEESGRFFW